ncbi:protein FAM214B [Platysternon megacephalum]|uniref:Protein FAM214B n=1 Tax=Platysternon megacephalum TaxID=55544 RepID=A0A4D9EF83_9SAUR|nr:protein FAM214B [Platysternon megacephalum]
MELTYCFGGFLGLRVPLVVQFAWMDTQRLYKVDDLSCQPNAAMSSVVSASVTPLEMLTLAQLVGKNSITNSTIQFIYKHLNSSQDSLNWILMKMSCICDALKIKGATGCMPTQL